MTELSPTRIQQVTAVRNDSGSAIVAIKPALVAAGVDVGDTVAFSSQHEPRLVVASKVDEATDVDRTTRTVRRQHAIALPSEFYEQLLLDSPSKTADGDELGRVAVYAVEDGGTVAFGTDAGPAVETI